MCYVPIVLITLSCFAQGPQSAQTNLPESSAQSAPPSAAEAVVPETTAQAETTPESEVDKFLRETADKIDKIPYVSADIAQTIRFADREIKATGIYKKGPDYRLRFELNVDMGDAVGKRIQVCNGKMGYRYEQLADTQVLHSFDVAAIVPLVERKDLPVQAKEQILTAIPFLKPGDMLRGFLRTLTFTEKEESTIGNEHKRDVLILQGHWKKELLQSITGSPNVPPLEEFGQGFPQYARVYLDKETGWPIRIELYHQNNFARLKPIFRLEFLKVTFTDKLPEDAFAFTIPKDVAPLDVTTQLVAQLQSIPDKEGTESTPAPQTESSISAPISP